MNHHVVLRHQAPELGRILLGLLFTFALSANVFPQGGQRGAIAGTVRDTTGAALPGASLEIINQATNVGERTVITNTDGSFSATFLPVGPIASLQHSPDSPRPKLAISEFWSRKPRR